jgi:phosphoserine phosphatase
MEQLTQMELLQLHELLSSEELALKKCQTYKDQMQDDELMPRVEASIALHKDHVQQLINLVRQHNGKEGAIQ